MEFRPRRTRAEAELVKECARAHGVSARSVRAWREADDGRWREFIRQRAAAGSGQGFLSIAEDASTNPRIEEEAAARRFLAIQKMIDAEIAAGRTGTLPPLLKAGQESQKLLDACRESRRRWEVHLGEAFTREDVRSWRRQLAALAEVVRNMPSEVGPKANSFDPAFGIQACEGWLRNRYTPALDRILRSLDAAAGSDPEETQS